MSDKPETKWTVELATKLSDLCCALKGNLEDEDEIARQYGGYVADVYCEAIATLADFKKARGKQP